MRRVVVAVLAAILGCMLAGCAGVGSRMFGPATNGQSGTLSRNAGRNVLQQNDGAQFVEFSTDCLSMGQLSHDVTGVSMWFTEPYGCHSARGAVGSIAIATGAITHYKLPSQSRPFAATENAGYVWVADMLKVAGVPSMYRFTEDGTLTRFPLPSAVAVTSMTAGPDGNVWFVGAYVKSGNTLAGVGYMTPTGSSNIYQVMGSATPVLQSIASGADGNLWITDEQNGAIIKVNPATGAMTTYLVGGSPLYISSSSNALVYSDGHGAQLSVMTRNGKATVYPAPGSENPSFLARKDDGTVQFIDAANYGDGIGTFDPTSGAYTAWAQAPQNGLAYLFNGPDGNMWFTNSKGYVGAYLKFVLTTTPSTLSLGDGSCSASFTASEPGYNGYFSVASQNTGIATVSPATGGVDSAFTVTAVAAGSTSITVQDSMQNVVNVPVSVQTGCTNPAVFTYTGAQQMFVVPAGVTQLTVGVDGAAGHNARGGQVQATIPVTPGEPLAILVGGKGTAGEGSYGAGIGGFNGGGNASCGRYEYSGCGSGGGGASDIRQGGTALANRIIVAGGGGGESGEDQGGNGGGFSGRNGEGGNYGGAVGGGGGGGTQSAGGLGGTPGENSCDDGEGGLSGALGTGGVGGSAGGGVPCYGAIGGGGGGGGYYGGGGGGGGTAGQWGGGGGGGSSFVEPNATNVKDVRGGSKVGKIVISW